MAFERFVMGVVCNGMPPTLLAKHKVPARCLGKIIQEFRMRAAAGDQQGVARPISLSDTRLRSTGSQYSSLTYQDFSHFFRITMVWRQLGIRPPPPQAGEGNAPDP
jgi:hypothetical protein